MGKTIHLPQNIAIALDVLLKYRAGLTKDEWTIDVLKRIINPSDDSNTNLIHHWITKKEEGNINILLSILNGNDYQAEFLTLDSWVIYRYGDDVSQIKCGRIISIDESSGITMDNWDVDIPKSEVLGDASWAEIQLEMQKRFPIDSWVLTSQGVHKILRYKNDYIESYFGDRIPIQEVHHGVEVEEPHIYNALYNYFNIGDKISYVDWEGCTEVFTILSKSYSRGFEVSEGFFINPINTVDLSESLKFSRNIYSKNVYRS